MPKKILVIRFSSLGDVLLTTGVLHHLKTQQIDISIDFLTSREFTPLLSGNKDIHQVFSFDRQNGLFSLLQLYRQLPQYDMIFDLHGSLRSWLLHLFFKGPIFTYDKKSKLRRDFIKNPQLKSKLKEHVTQRYFYAFQSALGLAPAPLEDLRPQIYLKKTKLQIDLPEQFICIHPFASQKNKVWPFFSQLCQRLVEKNITPVVIGRGNFDDFPGVINLTNKTSLNETIVVISKSQALLSTDSGPLHIGCALNKKIIGLFGPTTKEFGFFPLFNNCFIIENNDLNCRPCHPHGGNTCPLSHFKCMNDISVDQVLQKIVAVLDI